MLWTDESKVELLVHNSNLFEIKYKIFQEKNQYQIPTGDMNHLIQLINSLQLDKVCMK